jgi:hypothetical protein
VHNLSADPLQHRGNPLQLRATAADQHGGRGVAALVRPLRVGEPRLHGAQAEGIQPIRRRPEERRPHRAGDHDDPTVAKRVPHPTAVEQHLLDDGLVWHIHERHVRRLGRIGRDPRRCGSRRRQRCHLPGITVVDAHLDPPAEEPTGQNTAGHTKTDYTYAVDQQASLLRVMEHCPAPRRPIPDTVKV